MLILHIASPAECTVTYISIIMDINLVCHKYALSMTSLPDIRITSEITSTLTNKDNPSSDALLSDDSSNGQETFVVGQ